MAPYKEESYSEVLRWLEDTEIEYVPHGKKAGTKSYDRYEKYSQGNTVKKTLELGAKPLDLVNDFEKKLLKRVGGPIRDQPLDLTSIEDTTTLTKTDLILARWGYVLGQKGADAAGEDGKAADGEDYAKKKEETRQAWRKAKLSAAYGVKVEDMAARVGWAESPSMVAGRSRANVEAAKILDAVANEGHKVSDEDVLRVLRLWVVKKNGDRKNVMPEGVNWVHSEILGLLHCSGGRLIATLHTKSYPKVLQLFARWLKDNRPEGHTQDFPFTSVIVNSLYCAKRHRDHINLGTSVVKAFGSFEGGRLRYWADDDKSSCMDALRDDDAISMDVKSTAAVIDGNRAHAVEPYTGEERFSLVFFTASTYAKAAPEVMEQLAQLDFPLTDEASEAYLKGLVPAAQGYGPPRPAEKRKLGLLKKMKGLKGPNKGNKGTSLLSRMLAIAAKRNKEDAEAAAADAAADAAQADDGSNSEQDGAKKSAEVEANGTPSKKRQRLDGGSGAGGQLTLSGEKQRAAKGRPAQAALFAGKPETAGAGAARQDSGPGSSAVNAQFRSLADVLSSATEAAVAVPALAEYFQGIMDGLPDAAEECLRSALDLLSPARVVPDSVLAAALAEAFGETVPPTLSGEALAVKALQGCQKKGRASAPPTIMQVATTLADGEVGSLAKLISSTSTEGMEAFFLIRCLQGKLGPGREAVHGAIARAMVKSSDSSSMLT